jgi:branched-chain amino acid transport system substrate-binding protein
MRGRRTASPEGGIMNRKLAIIVLVALCMTFGATASFAQSVIKLGANWSLADVTGVEGSKAAQLACDEINAAGGVLGRRLLLIVVDDEGKGDKGVAAIEKLVTVDKVDILMGGMASGVALAQVPTMKKYGIVTVATGAAASSTVEKALGPSPESDFYFHLHPWDYNQGQSYVDGWADIQKKYPNVQIKRIFLAYEEGAFGKASFDASKALFGGQYTFDGGSFKSALLGGSDYSGVLEAAKAFKPDLFLWAGYAPDAIPLLEQSKAMKFSPPIYLGAPPAWPADMAKQPLANNVMLYGMWAPSINDVSPVSKKFYDAYVKKYGAAPTNYFAPLSYSAVYVIADAIKRAGDWSKEKLIPALEATKYDSPLGQVITFSPSNVIKHQGIRNQKILQWQNGQQVVIWPFEAANKSIVYPFPAW